MYGFRSCPYCRKSYNYGRIISEWGRIRSCRFCHKKFAVDKKIRLIIMLCACVIAVIADVLVMFLLPELEKEAFKIMVMSDASVIASVFAVSPFFVRFNTVIDTAGKVHSDMHH